LKIDKLLAGTLALVLIAGIGTPVFADSTFTGSGGETQQGAESVTPDVNRPQIDEDDVIFDGGLGAFTIICGTVPPDTRCAVDFVFEDDSILTDVHFDASDFLVEGFIPEITYFIYADDEDTPGVPGVLKQTGQGVNVHKELIGGNDFRYWFDLDNPILLDGDTTFWISLNVFDWWNTSSVFGNPVAVTLDDAETWFVIPDGELNIVLTGHRAVVGGELLSIDTTSLLVAGAQSFSWMIPVVLSVIGIGLFVVSRNSENS